MSEAWGRSGRENWRYAPIQRDLTRTSVGVTLRNLCQRAPPIRFMISCPKSFEGFQGELFQKFPLAESRGRASGASPASPAPPPTNPNLHLKTKGRGSLPGLWLHIFICPLYTNGRSDGTSVRPPARCAPRRCRGRQAVTGRSAQARRPRRRQTGRQAARRSSQIGRS